MMPTITWLRKIWWYKTVKSLLSKENWFHTFCPFLEQPRYPFLFLLHLWSHLERLIFSLVNRIPMFSVLIVVRIHVIYDTYNYTIKVEKILKGSLNLIPSPIPSVKIQIMGGKVCLRCKGRKLLGIINKFLKTKSLLTSPSNV